MFKPVLGWTGFAMLLVGAALAGDPPQQRLAAPGTQAWQPLHFPRIERGTRYTPFQEGELRGVRSESECSASALVLPLDRAELDARLRLRWRWRVEQGLELSDERTARATAASKVRSTSPSPVP